MNNRDFTDINGDILAYWLNDGSECALSGIIDSRYIPDFILWLRQGPPKPKYRITKTFDFKPTGVVQRGAFVTRNLDITDNDIEETA